MTTPPRLARWLIERALPADVREDVSGDLFEMYRRRLDTSSGRAARRWYWRQTAAFIARFAAQRLREWWHTTDMSLGFSWIDIRLALRMLVRYPGLTAVGVVGMATAIAIAAAAFTVIDAMMDPAIPIDEGDRVVSLVGWDAATNNRELRLMHDFAMWRGHLTTLHEIGAARTVTRNLIAPGAQPETIAIAEMTASGFAIARVSPLLGRPVLVDDERAGAPNVVVVGHEVWQRRFAGDPEIVGRQIQLGDALHTVVGVMPKGFGFPVNHNFWIPWRTPDAFPPRTGPQINVFGRLASGVRLETAQLEVASVGARTAAEHPTSHEHLRPRVLPYAYAFTDMDDPDNALALRAIQTALVLLLVVVCVNVAILVYARTATRQGEIAVRSALGASRRRIVAQLFLEALVLSAAAAIAGIGLVAIGLGQLHTAATRLAGGLPFWMSLTLSPSAVLYIVGLAVLAAAIVGVVPALQATGGRIQARLQGLSAGSGSRMQMGRLWTGLIIAQVAVAVALLPATVFHAWNSLRSRADSRGATTREVLTTILALDRPLAGRLSESDEQMLTRRYATLQQELERRLESEGSVSHVTFSMAGPGEELALVLEVEGVPAPVDLVDYNIVEGSKQGHLVRFNRVAPDFFDAFEVPVLTGRGLRPGDRDAVVVGRSLAEQISGSESVLGRRIRYVGRSREADPSDVELGHWYEIVGVVPDFPVASEADRPIRRIYHAVAPGEMAPVLLSVRVRAMAPAAFAQRLREISASVDPNLQLRNLTSVDEVIQREQGLLRLIGLTLVAVMSSVVVLSAAGIYALMSFTVSRRRKEIGIRAALGADPSRILRHVFSRAFVQLACGAALGMLGAVALEQMLEGETFQGHGAVILPAVAVFMTTVGLLAAYGPARRGLAIQPTEALREE